jgi:hypothetical protein
MNRQFLLFSVTGLALMGVSAGLAMAKAVEPKVVNQPVNQPLCYMQHPNLSQQDLTKICGQSALIPVPGHLDPKAPVDFQMPRSRTPSALWNRDPDAVDVPIEIGKTYTPAASQPSKQPAAAAQPPSGGDDAAIDDD